MDLIIWNDSMSVGVKKFDDEHKQLISFVNELNNALKLGSATKTIETVLDKLIKYTVIHFNHEEEYMKLYEYPGITGHLDEHRGLTTQVNEFSQRLKAGKASFSIELLNFLRDWLTNHILKIDMAYKDYFAKKGVM